MRRALLSIPFLALALPGCGVFFAKDKEVPPPTEYTIMSPYPEVRTLAIAPTINLSGSRDFDPLVVSDKLFEEMQQVQGLNVLPLNKTLLVMQRMGIRSIEDAKTAQRIATALHVDGLVIPAITAYDPYNPPIVGMVLQLYTPEAPPVAAAPPPKPLVPVAAPLPPAPAPGGPTPIGESALSNPGTPTIVADVNPGALGTIEEKRTLVSSVNAENPRINIALRQPETQPVSQVSAVFNATNQTVLKEISAFAAGRTEYDSALSDQRYIMDTDSYVRFVAHAMVRRLIDLERERTLDR